MGRGLDPARVLGRADRVAARGENLVARDPALARCAECCAQMKQGREALPHPKLRLLRKQKFQRKMRDGPYEETVYECWACTSTIMHTTDANEFPPFWWFTN
jgi:hypothetical protein